MYEAKVRFIATMSGLTRWQFIFGEVEVDSDQEFGDFHSKAIEEPWYKSAILQHQIDKDSFVYSVPHQSDVKEGNETQVTASMAIFPRDGGNEAPIGVVGFQFSLQMMYDRFMEITSKVSVSFSRCDPVIVFFSFQRDANIAESRRVCVNAKLLFCSELHVVGKMIKSQF